MSLKKQALSGIAWTFAQQTGVQLINFGVQIVLARLLMPEMFGLVAMINVFIAIGKLLMDGGMTTSLIRTENPNHLDYSTVFSTNILVSLGLYGLIFLGAPYISAFNDQPILTDLVRVFALSFVINAFVAVHVAKLTKEMNFKKQMTIQIPSTLIGGATGVTMAYLGYGVWANPEEVKHEYGITCHAELDLASEHTYNAIALAVAHKQFLSMDLTNLKAEHAVVYDVKGVIKEVEGKL